ncbi:MAG: ATP-binding protein [Phycisphaeraceae bacterium]|nr:ATP-binding protein [Phycisphaeraceae bacterium]MBX3366547.1 ATP-binding protein [Phycisphaeraceae bacterium]
MASGRVQASLGDTDYGAVIAEQNPWVVTGSIPGSLARDVERPLAKSLWRRLLDDRLRRHQLVIGPRRVGKTTTMYQTVRHLLDHGIERDRLWWLRLDHPVLMSLSLDRLLTVAMAMSKATPARPAYVFLDELSYAKDWDRWLKSFHDAQLPVVIAGTSSATFDLVQRGTESGIGRWEEQHLAPYLFTEYLELVGDSRPIPDGESLDAVIRFAIDAPPNLIGLEPHRRRLLLTGGFPELLLATGEGMEETDLLLESQRTLRLDAIERAIYKDIPQAVEVRSPEMLERLLYVLAGQIGGILSPQKICLSMQGLSQPTFDRYLSYLERSFLVFTLQNYAPTEDSRQKRGRKLYFVDPAIRNAALQRGIGPLTNSVELGALYENMAASHLHALSRQTLVRSFHWRDKDEEVDLIYDHPTHPLAFEIKSSVDTSSHAGLAGFVERHPRFRGRCYIVNQAAIPRPATDDRPGVLPFDLFLMCVGAHADREQQRRLGVHRAG